MAQKLYRVVEARWVGGDRVESDLGCAWKPEAKAREEVNYPGLKAEACKGASPRKPD